MEDAILRKKEKREKINEKRREMYRKTKYQIYTCICGITLTVSNKAYHEKKQIHLNYI